MEKKGKITRSPEGKRGNGVLSILEFCFRAARGEVGRVASGGKRGKLKKRCD